MRLTEEPVHVIKLLILLIPMENFKQDIDSEARGTIPERFPSRREKPCNHRLKRPLLNWMGIKADLDTLIRKHF